MRNALIQVIDNPGASLRLTPRQKNPGQASPLRALMIRGDKLQHAVDNELHAHADQQEPHQP